MELPSSAVRTPCDMEVDGAHGPGRPKMTWKKLAEKVPAVCRE